MANTEYKSATEMHVETRMKQSTTCIGINVKPIKDSNLSLCLKVKAKCHFIVKVKHHVTVMCSASIALILQVGNYSF